MKLLIIEDEIQLLAEIAQHFEAEKFVCETVSTFNDAEEKIHLYVYDVAIVDLTLPGGNGLDLINMLKSVHPETGIIIVSAKNALDDKLTGLDIGADDYITKPFHLSELNARVKALIRRKFFSGSQHITFNEIEVVTDDNSIVINDTRIVLTKKEYDLLVYFISNKNRIVTKESIAEHLWGDNIDMVDNFDFIYTHINNLRKKITQNGGHDYIQTIYGMGYKFSEL